MSSREAGEYCLDCHWEETFDDIMGKLPMLPSGPWQCDDVHPATDAPCGVEDGYCAKDTCSLNCSSVCDGFVDCDLVSTVCSNANCEEALCESTASACFDTHCCEQGQNEGNNNNTTTGLLRQPGFQWEPALFLPAMAEPQTDMSFNESQMINHSAAARCHQNCTVDNTVSDSQCHNPACDFVFTGQMYPQDCGNPWISTLPSNSMAPSNVDANVMMNNATFDAPLQYPNSARFNPEGNPTKMPCFQADGQQSCADEGFQHLGCYLRNSGDTRLVEFSKQQSQSRVHRHFHGQAHHHELTHHTAPCNSRKSVSSPTISSFIDSPPSLDRAISSALTSPTPPFKEETTANAHVCRWSCGKSSCNASFSCCGDLQQHLVTHHMQPIDGSKGHGYYCCWEGCHRPHEPFSQKSKLQGHFLTHSNYKNYTCSVCGKAFARQATLERHERSHRGEKPFKCKECGKAFTDSSELKTHSRTHTGEKPFKCTFPGCDFQTGDSSNMSSHKLTHIGRRHKCSYPGCEKCFTRADQLKRHLKSTHKQDNQSRSLGSKPKPNSMITVS